MRGGGTQREWEVQAGKGEVSQTSDSTVRGQSVLAAPTATCDFTFPSAA